MAKQIHQCEASHSSPHLEQQAHEEDKGCQAQTAVLQRVHGGAGAPRLEHGMQHVGPAAHQHSQGDLQRSSHRQCHQPQQSLVGGSDHNGSELAGGAVCTGKAWVRGRRRAPQHGHCDACAAWPTRSPLPPPQRGSGRTCSGEPASMSTTRELSSSLRTNSSTSHHHAVGPYSRYRNPYVSWSSPTPPIPHPQQVSKTVPADRVMACAYAQPLAQEVARSRGASSAAGQSTPAYKRNTYECAQHAFRQTNTPFHICIRTKEHTHT
jgi:hypothetical protein